MKTLILATASLIALASVSSAAELAGTGIVAGSEVDFNYTTGVDEFALEATPYVGFDKFGVAFTVETTVDILAINDGDVFQGLDFSAEYDLGQLGANGVTAYGEVSTDADLDFGDVTVGAKLAF